MEMVRTLGEKYRRICSNENVEDGNEWTPEDRKTKTEVDTCGSTEGRSTRTWRMKCINRK